MNNQNLSNESSYNNELFVVVSEENKKEIISDFCKSIIKDIDNSVDEQDILNYDNRLEELLKKIPKPYTIVLESYHIDPCFRDLYYTYYSNQHFQIKRYSKRLSFFSGVFTEYDYFDEDTQKDEKIRNSYMGSCVINPFTTGVIGRTLINPKYLISDLGEIVYLRLSKFFLHVYGKKLSVLAFPYRMQDEETISCAEVTLLNLLEYYSNSYNDYKRVVPNEIFDKIKQYSHERVLPSQGLTYPMLTKVLNEFGFAPRLYNVDSIQNYTFSSVKPLDELKRWMHYYVESGIPVALNLSPVNKYGNGHSIICIGHGKYNEKLKIDAKSNKWVSWSAKDYCHPLINSADFFEKYVIIDDNEPVYQLRSFEQLSMYSDLTLQNIAVPLYKRMFLDAPDAFAATRAILQHKEYGIHEWCDILKPCEDVIVRFFMASSNSFKEYRINTLNDYSAKKGYSIVPMPRFIWVCELYREKDYDEKMAFGEIIMDATSVTKPGRTINNLILMHYPGKLAFRFPEQKQEGFDKYIKLEENNKLFKGYVQKNLVDVKSL